MVIDSVPDEFRVILVYENDRYVTSIQKCIKALLNIMDTGICKTKVENELKV